MMPALGLEDRMIGSAFSDGPPSDEWAARGDGIPVISDKVPGQEKTLDLEPDLVYADQVVVLDGRVVASGAPAETLTSELLQSVYGVRADVLAHPADGSPLIAFSPLEAGTLAGATSPTSAGSTHAR